MQVILKVQLKHTKEVGRIYYEKENDDAFAWGGVL